MSTPQAPPDATPPPAPPAGGPQQDPPDPKGEQKKIDPEKMAAVSRPVLHFGLFMLAALIAMQLNLPWQLASLAFAGAAIYVGVRAIIRVIKARAGGTIVVLLAFGLTLTGLLVITSISNLALWNEEMERQRCLSSAVTVSAEDRCEQEYQRAVEERLGNLLG